MASLLVPALMAPAMGAGWLKSAVVTKCAEYTNLFSYSTGKRYITFSREWKCKQGYRHAAPQSALASKHCSAHPVEEYLIIIN